MDAERLHRPLLYLLPGMDAVERQHDLVYKRTDSQDLLLDVYRPAPPPTGGRLPAILFVHGGPLPVDLPLRPKDWGIYRSYGALAAAAGWAGVTFNHRFFALRDLPTAAADVASAIEYVRTRSDALGIAADRLAVWVFSGGGPLLAPILRERPPFVRCLVADYASLDLRDLPRQVADGVPDEVLHQFSPAAHLAEEQPPVLVARAGRDTPGLNGSIARFVEAALAANLDLTLLNHPRGRHGFDAEDDLPRTGEIIAATLSFVRAHLA
ncbi:MAG TPA: hypothetical protein VG370_02770 [Chloroflexota bacterium]|jgi:acetyl esterase/lipase|nr:hypothetical protein [Chloroflexota bacterium]